MSVLEHLEVLLSHKFHENTMLGKVMLVLVSYSIVQILAQDLGIPSGKRQSALVHWLPFQMVLLFAGAFSVTQDTKLATITTGTYYVLKYVYSMGQLADM